MNYFLALIKGGTISNVIMEKKNYLCLRFVCYANVMVNLPLVCYKIFKNKILNKYFCGRKEFIKNSKNYFKINVTLGRK